MTIIISEDALILKKRFLHICDNNLIATLLLYQFEHDDDTEDARAGLENRETNVWFYNDERLAKRLYNLFSCEEINKACQFLTEKGFISTWWHKDNNTQPSSKRFYYVQYNAGLVSKASEPYEEEQWLQQQLRYAQREKSGEVSEIPSPKPRNIKLENRYKTEASRVALQNNRAAKLGLPATLTLEQWIVTLDHFNWVCAYCQGKYTVIEHFVPLSHGKGTEKDNCVPACHKCNSHKGTRHPSQITDIGLTAGIKGIYKYIASLESEARKEVSENERCN